MVLSNRFRVRMMLEGDDWMAVRFAVHSMGDVERAKASMSCDFAVSSALFWGCLIMKVNHLGRIMVEGWGVG
jgi:hypothetical protein